MAKTKHGLANTVQYGIWLNMKNRCLNTRDEQFPLWGGRGITVCERWMDFTDFWADMGPTYVPGLTLERIENNLGYSKENCRWATRQEQARNRRTNIVVDSLLGPLVLKDFWRLFGDGISYQTLIDRHHKGVQLLS